MAYTKQQKETGTLVALALVAGIVWFGFMGKGGVNPISTASAGPYRPIEAQDYSVVLDRLRKAQSTEYKASGRNIFVAAPIKVEAPAPKPVEAPPPQQGPQLPPPPQPPTLPANLKFFGYGTLPSGGPRQAFLLDGDEVRIVNEGDVILNHIRINRIGNDMMEFEDTTTGLRNSTRLEMPPAT